MVALDRSRFGARLRASNRVRNNQSIKRPLATLILAFSCCLPSFADAPDLLPSSQWSTEATPGVGIMAVENAPRYAVVEILNETPSPNGEIVARTFTYRDGGSELLIGIQFEFVASAGLFEIIDLPLPYRPIDNVHWLNNRYLVFERWSQPHYGWLYIVDALQWRLAHSQAIWDEVYESRN